MLEIHFLLAAAPAPGSAEPTTVYRYLDVRGLEHYVNHRSQIPAGVAARAIDLATVPLNPEVEKALEAQRPAPALLPAAPANQTATLPAPSPDALLWGQAAAVASFGFLLVILFGALARRAARRGGNGLSVNLWLPPLRAILGGLALMGWLATGYALRDRLPGLARAFPPLQAWDRARATTDRVQRQQQQLERELDGIAKDK